MIVITSNGPTVGPQARGTVFLPLVMTLPRPEDPIRAAFANNLEYEFYQLLVTDQRQQRPALTVCPALILAAQQRAHGLRGGDPWAHHDSNGKTPNEYARDAGCNHPYGNEPGNYVESLVAGSPNMGAMLNALANSPSHADHIFGRNDFFRRQDKVGIGVAVGGKWGWYCCVMISECGE